MGNPVFSYTHRDYESARQEGLAKIPILSKGTWTDLNATDPGIVLLDYVHALVDMVQFYQDHNALESFLSTAKERKNIFRLAKQLSYKIRSAKGARVDVEFYTENVHGRTIFIPKYTKLKTNSKDNKTPINYLTAEAAYINVCASSVSVPCMQGELVSTEYRGTGINRYSSDEDVNQSVTLQDKGIDIDTIEVVDDTGFLWSPVDYLVFANSSDKVYESVLNEDGSITIKFGDGERGATPTPGDHLTITYVKTLGESGRTGAHTITVLNDSLLDIEGNKVNVRVDNTESTTGGSEAQSDEDIVANAPGAIKAQDRAVTLGDFVALSKNIDGVEDAIALDINKAPDLCLHHEVKVIIIPKEGSSANNSLLNTVYNYLYSRMVPATNLQVLAPNYVPINVAITVKKNPSYLEGGLDYSVKEAVESFFLSKNTALGESFNPNELISAVSSVSGVRFVTSIDPNSVVTVGQTSIVSLNELSITVE